MDRLTDELLAAYSDGELSRKDALWVETELDRSPEAQMRLDAFRRVSTLVRASHRTAVPQKRRRVVPSFWSRPVSVAQAGLACACTIGLLWGGSGLLAPRVEISHTTALLETASRFISADGQRVSDVGPAGEVETAAWLSRELGLPFGVPNLSGWTFTGSRILKSGWTPTAGLVYTAPDLRQIVLCITPIGRQDRPLTSTIAQGLRVAEWEQHGYSLALIGQLSTDEVRRLSHDLRRNSGSWAGRPGSKRESGPGMGNDYIRAAPYR